MDSAFTAQSYRSVQNPVDSESDSSDSDSSDDVWKRKSSRKRGVANSPVKTEETRPALAVDDSASHLLKKRKCNTVWCNVLQEQSVADDLVQFGLKTKPVSLQDRSCESYDFRLSSLDPRRIEPSAMEDDFSDSKDVSDDLQLDEQASENSEQKNGSNVWWPKSLHESKELVDKVAKKIIRVLNEPKRFIIYRVVRVLGSQKALQLLEETEKIEEDGGMLVVNNSRRRTPGGTFLQLLKKDPSVSNKKKSIIFAEDRRVMPPGKQNKKSLKRSKRKKKNKKDTESMDIVCETTDAKDKTENAEQNDSSSSSSRSDLNDTENTGAHNGNGVQDAENNSSNGKPDAQVIPNVKEDSELEEGEITD